MYSPGTGDGDGTDVSGGSAGGEGLGGDEAPRLGTGGSNTSIIAAPAVGAGGEVVQAAAAQSAVAGGADVGSATASKCIVLRVYGMHLSLRRTITFLRMSLEKQLTGMTLGFLTSLLIKNRLYKLSSADLECVYGLRTCVGRRGDGATTGGPIGVLLSPLPCPRNEQVLASGLLSLFLESVRPCGSVILCVPLCVPCFLRLSLRGLAGM
jgi:hypothetical protein